MVKPTDKVKKYQLKPADIFILFEIYLSLMERDEILRILLDWNYWGDYSFFRVI